MKTILLLTTLGLGSLITVNHAHAADNVLEQPAASHQKFVEIKEEKSALPAKKAVRVQVEYIIAENNKNYVIFIKSDHPELHQKIISMISNMPVDPAGKDKKHNLVIEYEL